MKVVIIGVAALVVGLGAGTAVSVARRPPAPAASDSTHTAQPTPVGTGAPAHAAPDHDDSLRTMAAATPAAVAEHAPEHAAAPPKETHAEPPPAAHASAGAEKTAGGSETKTHGGDPETYRQVAKILTNMKPTDAGKIIGYLSDAQVEGLLRAMGVRQAAGLLTQIPTERAARLSRRLIDGPVAEGR